ncbi:MAG: hypothetical protein OXF74_02870 [Rhodobacteraceae bacterium]|nr:hypothetical protein [Paracoccaceae bacterium]
MATHNPAKLRRGDHKTALLILLPLAEGGDVETQGIIGYMHEHGVPKNGASPPR